MPRPSSPWFRAASGTWVSRVRGKLVTLARGRGAGKEAAARLREILAANPQLAARAVEDDDIQAVTLDELAKQFLDFAERQFADSTFRGWRWYLLRFAGDIGGERPASGLVALDLLRWAESTGWAVNTRHVAISAVQRCFSWGVQVGLLRASRLVGCPKPGSTRRERCPVSDEVAQLIAASREPFRSIAFVLAETGARPSELCRARARDYEAAEQRLRLSRHKTARKVNRARIIYLTGVAADVVAAHCRARGEDEAIFRNHLGRPWLRNTLEWQFRATRRRVGLGDHVTSYSLRHWWATEKLRAGVPIAIVAELLGHTSTAMVSRHYSHLSDHAADLRAAVERRA